MVSIGGLRNMIDKVLRKSLKSSCLTAESAGRKRDTNPNFSGRHHEPRLEAMKSLFDRLILTAAHKPFVEDMTGAGG